MGKWELSGFSDLIRGSFENGGQNLYVSRKGVLQRIWRFDVTNSGYTDIPVANSHDYSEHPALYIVHDPAGEAGVQKVLTQGCNSAAAGDLNNDGFDDLVLCSMHDGHHSDLASYVYFGGSDGITEDRKVDLAAPMGHCVRMGDFNGDGKKELVYLVADGPDQASPTVEKNLRLRLYRMGENGFRMNDFRECPTDMFTFAAADIDGDGICDLYGRRHDGTWCVYWGGQDGFSPDRVTEIGHATDDEKRFNILPSGGGNVGYTEYARPKILTFGGKQYLLFADENEVRFIHMDGRTPDGNDVVFPIPHVQSAAVGHIESADTEDIVFLTVDDLTSEHILVYFGSRGFETPVYDLPCMTPRDVLLYDFSGSGHDDIAVAQGRNTLRHTTESLLFVTGGDGNICTEPRRFVTHNCAEIHAADFDGSGKKQLVLVNQEQSTAYGHIPVYIFLGGPDGYRADRRLEFAGHSAGSIICADVTDNGWPDVIVLQNAEDQPHLKPPADVYFGGPDGFSAVPDQQVAAPLAWGGHLADLDRDGYLDLIAVCGDVVRIFYGGPDGFSDDRMKKMRVMPDLPEGTAVGSLWPALCDLNGNGWLDLVVPCSWLPESVIFWGGPDGFSEERRTLLPVDDALTVRIADLNKNGYPDLVFGSRASYYRNVYQEGSVTIFWGGPDGYSGFRCCVLPSYQSNNITIQDLNNDGWLDIFASSYFNKKERDINSFIYWNDHGHFSLTNRKRIFAHSSSAALACDFNEDGYVDLFVSHHRAYGSHYCDSAIWWNGPDGFSEDRRTWLPTIGPHDMVPNDVGNVMTRGPEEAYTSPAMEAGPFRSIRWEGKIPKKTWVNCQIRTGGSIEELQGKPFIGKDGTEETRFENGEAVPAALIEGAYLQVKLYLGAVNSGNTPRITRIFAEEA